MTKSLYEKYLIEHPLSSSELALGAALRAVKCVRASRLKIAWVFLYFSNDMSEDLGRPDLRGFGVLVPNQYPFFENQNEVALSIEGELWQVKEFEIVLPRPLVSFSLAYGKASCRIRQSFRNKLVHCHYEETLHAAVDSAYPEWAKRHRLARLTEERPTLNINPLMSIVTPVYHTKPSILRETLESVKAQIYQNWELIIVNASPENKKVREVLSQVKDEKISIIELAENQGIVGNTNVGIAATKGDYVSFLDHDDLIESDALLSLVQAIEESKEQVDLIYCDEDSIDEQGGFHTPLFKPSRNPDLLYSNDYVLHWLTVSRRILEMTTRSDKVVEGAQDYDLTLKVMEAAEGFIRVPEVLYHWRSHRGSINSNPDSKPYSQLAGQRAIENHFKRRGVVAEVSQEWIPCTYRAGFSLTNRKPKISCIVVGEEIPEGLTQAITEYEKDMGGCLADILLCESDSILARNECVSRTKGDLLFFCSSNIGEVSERFFEVLVGYFDRLEVGIVAPRVIRSDGLIDYAGICVQPGGLIMHMNRFVYERSRTYIDRATRPYDSSVVNSEYQMLRTCDYRGLEGFDPGFLSSTYASADFCMRSAFTEKLSLYTPFAEVRQKNYQSMLSACEAENSLEDVDLFMSRYGHIFSDGDPSHNPNFDPESPYYRLKW